MAIPTTAEIALLRQRPHSTKLWLSIYTPPTVLACRVATSHGIGGRQIDYDTVTQGSYTAVESGMTLYVGSTPGGWDLGKLRVRSASSTQITVAENSDVNWTVGQYLTVVRFWEINAIFPRIIPNPSNPEQTIWYKDYDIVYTNQNDFPGSFICMGGHWAGFLASGSCQVFYSASGTSSVHDESLTYSWWIQGANVTGSSAHTPGFATYTGTGHFTTRLQVTTPSGTVDSSYRHISIYDRPGAGSAVPILEWNLTSMSGSRDAGGYVARIRVHQNLSSVMDGALVVIFADDVYGTTSQSIGGSGINRQSIVFAGYILDGSTNVNYRDSVAEFSVGSPTEVMKLTEGFAVGLNSSANPSTEPTSNPDIPSSWVAIKNMNVKRAMYHYLKWHSTVLLTNDFEFSGQDQNIQYFDADRESLYDAVQNIMNGALLGEVVSDRQGKIWSEVGVFAVSGSSVTYPTNLIMTNQDWLGDISIEEIQSKPVSFLEMGGIYYPGPGNDSTALLASSPGSSPAYRGSLQRIQGLALASQGQLNLLVGENYAWKNARYPNIPVNLAGNYRNFDIAPQERVLLTLYPQNNVRNITWVQKPFFIRSIEYNYNSQREVLLPRLQLHEATAGISATTISIPAVPPVEGYNIPQITVPAIPSFPITITTIGGGGGSRPSFIPVQAAWDVTAGEDRPLTINSIAVGPAKYRAEPSTTDSVVTAGFIIPPDYSGQLTIYFVSTNQNLATGNIELELRYDEEVFNGSYWTFNSYTTDVITESLTGRSGVSSRMYADWPLTLSVSANDFIRLWARRNGTTDTYNGWFGMLGWYIEYG